MIFWIASLRTKEAYKTEAEALNKEHQTLMAYINSESVADRSYAGLTFPKFTAVDVMGRETLTDFSTKKGGLVLLFTNNLST